MKKIVFIIFAVAIASCSTEEIVEPVQNDTTSKFTGDFKLVTTVISAPSAGELISATTHDCPNTWTFQADFELKKNIWAFDEVNRECTYRYQSSNSYTTPEENVIVVGGQTTYKIIGQGDNVILETRNTQTDRMIEHFLERI